MEYVTAKQQVPIRWSERGTGAISVYSIVPSQRSHEMVSATTSNTADK